MQIDLKQKKSPMISRTVSLTADGDFKIFKTEFFSENESARKRVVVERFSCRYFATKDSFQKCLSKTTGAREELGNVKSFPGALGAFPFN